MDTKKKYILFQFDTYYPSGGIADITAKSDSLDELKKKAAEDYHDWAYIVDRDTWQTVWDQDEPKVSEGRYLETGYIDGATIIELMDAYEHLLANNKHLEDSTPYCWGAGLTISMDMPGSGINDMVEMTLVVGDKSEADNDR